MVKSILLRWTSSLNDRSKWKGDCTDVKSGSGTSVGPSLNTHSLSLKNFSRDTVPLSSWCCGCPFCSVITVGNFCSTHTGQLLDPLHFLFYDMTTSYCTCMSIPCNNGIWGGDTQLGIFRNFALCSLIKETLVNFLSIVVCNDKLILTQCQIGQRWIIGQQGCSFHLFYK